MADSAELQQLGDAGQRDTAPQRCTRGVPDPRRRGVRRRRAAALPADSAAGELAAWERECAAAAAARNERAAERLAAARSWRQMLADSGHDPAIGDLLLVFARDDLGGVLP